MGSQWRRQLDRRRTLEVNWRLAVRHERKNTLVQDFVPSSVMSFVFASIILYLTPGDACESVLKEC